MNHWNKDELKFILQFLHPEKILSGMPGIDDSVSAEEIVPQIFALSPEIYHNLRSSFKDAAWQAARELLMEPAFNHLFRQLPFPQGAKIVGLGDSISDDYQSWVEILRCLFAQGCPEMNLQVINAGVSGDTTADVITRFLAVVEEKPDWIICMIGTNDARRHGVSPQKTLVSLEETKLNLEALRCFAASQTEASWIWMTPATVIEEQVAKHWYLGPYQLAWKNSDLLAIGAIIRQLPDPAVDLQAVFGLPPDPQLLLADGLHPSLVGQKLIVRTLVEALANLR